MLFLSITIVRRVINVLTKIRIKRRKPGDNVKDRGTPSNTVIIAGSGTNWLIPLAVRGVPY